MTSIGESLPVEQKLMIAGALYSPTYVARWYGRMVCQFYDREAFDRSARRMRAIYGFDSARNAETFRNKLDRLLVERDEPAIQWDSEAR